jgi:hypothetical protein
MTIQLPKVIASIPPAQQRPFPLGAFSLALAACAILCGFRRSKVLRLAFAMVVLACATVMFTGCNGGLAGGPSTKVGSAVITVTGTSGSHHASTTVTLVVQWDWSPDKDESKCRN